MGGGMTRREFLAASGGALVGAFVVGGCGGGAGGGGGSGWEPERNVVMIVPFEPGGGSDILGRAMAAGLEEVREGVNVSVENRAGGSGAVGYSYLLEQRGDPHFLLASETAGVALPITTETPFRWTDFTPVIQIAEDATLLIVRRGSDHRSLRDVIDAAREGRVTVGVAGATGLDTIVTSLMEEQTGVKFERVVFESGGEIVAALLGGDIEIASLNPSEVIGQLEAGEMRALAVFADERYERGMLAEIPTAKEEGVDVSFTQYRGAFAAGGITPEQRRYWERAFVDWTERQSYEKYIRDNYLISVVRTGEEFESYLRDYERTLEKVLGGSSS
ncbi:hypothetical protein RxyAA322_20870 [Rubrobacter xylanophilus]|uniref:Twin-arginine translocation pathway signal n=1 Tax=Rubrobacter xylanophilus TaxID=49319 RepID=A0A510HNG2_9ACTN|nr:tripartite tricarboxylate transporter substrate binding protein [Rubrobacter xylanophilus]BBL80233.1 hypothetical protein RxyAA322_20870 [Rubrobacter xylanophilus]